MCFILLLRCFCPSFLTGELSIFLSLPLTLPHSLTNSPSPPPSPIQTQEKMIDPVIAQDGHTYERKAIEAWFGTSSMSPMTNAQLPNGNKTLLPNFNLKSQISSWDQEAESLINADM